MTDLPTRPPSNGTSEIAASGWISGPMVSPPERDWVVDAVKALIAFGGDLSADDAGLLLTMWVHRDQLSAADLEEVVAAFGED